MTTLSFETHFRLLGHFVQAAKDLRTACKLDFDEVADEWLKEVTPNVSAMIVFYFYATKPMKFLNPHLKIHWFLETHADEVAS